MKDRTNVSEPRADIGRNSETTGKIKTRPGGNTKQATDQVLGQLNIT